MRRANTKLMIGSVVCMFFYRIELSMKFELIKKKMEFFKFILLLILSAGVCAPKCAEKCYCGEEGVSCSGALNPVFSYNPKVFFVYMELGIVFQLSSLLSVFPNLRSLTYRNMLHLNCRDIENVPREISVTLDFCPIFERTSPTEGKYTTYNLF